MVVRRGSRLITESGSTDFKTCFSELKDTFVRALAVAPDSIDALGIHLFMRPKAKQETV